MVIAVPLEHPEIGLAREGANANGEYPLLTLPEQRRSRHSGSTRASLQVDRSGSASGSNRVSLPHRVSSDLARRRSSEVETKLDKGKGKAVEDEREDTLQALERPTTAYSVQNGPSGISFDKARIMSTDLERGPDAFKAYEGGGTSNLPDNASHTSFQSGIGAALSDNTSIVGSDGPPANAGEEWGPQHPCYPHLNPHVPLSSPLYQTTRIIRIRRDWMIEGDLAPTFSNLYPEILDPAGVSEQDFRTLVEHVNKELVPAFSPWDVRNVVDGVLGLLTGWLWDDFGWTAVKGRAARVEKYIEGWNREMAGRSKEEGVAPRIVPLRRTGYMNVSDSSFLPLPPPPPFLSLSWKLTDPKLDIQVPDPEITYGESRANTGLSHVSQ